MDYIIETPRIKVRRVRVEDAPIFCKYYNDGRLMESVGFKNGLNTTVEKLEKQFFNDLKSTDFASTKMYVIVDSNTDLQIGELAYGDLKLENKSCRIGIKICDLSYQGKGYGHEALIEFIKYLYEHYDLETIEIDTLFTNKRAIRLYEKIGAKTTEIFKNFWTNPEGISCDAIFFELKKQDFYSYIENL